MFPPKIQMFTYTYKKTDKGIYGDSFEKAIKAILNRRNADRVSGQGKTDFRFDRKNYEIKQNGTIIKYADNKNYIIGSNRVIYASHISYEIIDENDEEITISVDLADTQMYVLDKKEFVQYLLDNGHAKYNSARHEVNIQTLWNYKKDAYHGARGKRIEEWAREHEIDDNIIDEILERVWAE